MGTLRFADLQTRPTEVLDLTSLTLDEFQRLVPPFEAAFEAHMAAWRLDGRPRTARRYTTYTNCPLPTPEDRLTVYPRLPEDVSPPSGPGAAVRAGPERSASVDSCPLGGPPGDAAHAGGCSRPVHTGVGHAPRGNRGRCARHGPADAWTPDPSRAACTGTCFPPFGHDGTERRIARPQDPTEQMRYYAARKHAIR